jgi:Septum formation/Domain of unknown function (DUF4190)
MTDGGRWAPPEPAGPPPPIHNRPTVPTGPARTAPPPLPADWRPPPAAGFRYGPPGDRKEPLATWALILGIGSFVVFPILAGIAAIVTGVMAIRRIDASGQTLTGHRSAVAGEVLGVVNVVLYPFVIFFVLVTLLGATTKHTQYTALRAGDCYNRLSSHSIFKGEVSKVACTEAHDTEVTGTFTASGATFPGTAGFRAQAQPECTIQARQYLDSGRVTGLDVAWLVPDQSTWNRGTHLVVCGVEDADGSRHTGSLRP